MEGSTVGDMFDFLSKEIIRLQVKTYKNGKYGRLIEIPSSTESFPLVWARRGRPLAECVETAFNLI